MCLLLKTSDLSNYKKNIKILKQRTQNKYGLSNRKKRTKTKN